MTSERLARITARLAASDNGGSPPSRLCEACADVMRMTGAGIMLMSDGVAQGSLCSSNPVAALIEDLQYTLGEGPCLDAYHQDRPVEESDLAAPGAGRWLAFSPRAVAAGARAVFGFPLRLGGIRLGALNLVRDRPGPLDDEQYADGLVLAGVAARAMLAMQAHARPGALGAALEAGADFRFVVHQAAGMASVQLDVGVGEALMRLRAHAFANDRPITDVARDVVARRLRFD